MHGIVILMASYRVSGSKKVAGVEPGGSISDADLEGVDIQHLEATGHLTRASSKAKKSDVVDIAETEEQSEEQE